MSSDVRTMTAPPLLKTRERSRVISGLAVLAVALAGTATLFAYDPAQHGFYPRCFLRAITGLNCPGCGSMRAIHQLLHGHILVAARLNLLLVLSMPGVAWWAARFGMWWMSGKAMMLDIRPRWMWALFAIASVFTILRNLPGYEWLAP